MKLPNGEQAIVDIAKLRDYCLSLSHPRGRHKAKVFSAVLGLGPVDVEFLRQELLAAARSLEAVPGETDTFGSRYRIDLEIVRGKPRSVAHGSYPVKGAFQN